MVLPFFFRAEDGIRARTVTGVQTCALPICEPQLVIRCAFADFGRLQEALEARRLTPLSAEHEYICTVPTELPEAKRSEERRVGKECRSWCSAAQSTEADDDIHA